MTKRYYQRLGLRTLFYDIVTSSKITVMILLVTLVPVYVKKYSSPLTASSNFDNLIDALIFWGSMATLAVFAITVLASWLEYMMFQFRLDADFLRIKWGVFSEEEIAIPYRRIESVEIRRNIIHLLFGVSRINIETTIDSDSTCNCQLVSGDEVLPAIGNFLAQNIQEELTVRSNVQKMRIKKNYFFGQNHH